LREQGNAFDLHSYESLVSKERERVRLHQWAMHTTKVTKGWTAWEDHKLMLRGSMLRLVVGDNFVWGVAGFYFMVRGLVLVEKNVMPETAESWFVELEQADVARSKTCATGSHALCHSVSAEITCMCMCRRPFGR